MLLLLLLTDKQTQAHTHTHSFFQLFIICRNLNKSVYERAPLLYYITCVEMRLLHMHGSVSRLSMDATHTHTCNNNRTICKWKGIIILHIHTKRSLLYSKSTRFVWKTHNMRVYLYKYKSVYMWPKALRLIAIRVMKPLFVYKMDGFELAYGLLYNKWKRYKIIHKYRQKYKLLFIVSFWHLGKLE